MSVRLPGHVVSAETVGLQAGKLARLALTLKPQTQGGVVAPAPKQTSPRPRPAEPAVGAEEKSGYLVANTVPWAKVLVDGKDTGKTTPVAPRQKIPLKPGRHKVTFVVDSKEYTSRSASAPDRSPASSRSCPSSSASD